MKISSKDFRVREGDEVNLKKWPMTVKPVYKSNERYEELLREHVAQLSSQQQLLYASNRHAVLLIFQAMDAAGKDGAIRHVMSGVNPQGCQVFSFKHPSPTELQRDLIWRHHARFAGTRADLHFHRPRASRDSPQRKDSGRAARRQSGVARPVRSITNLERHLHENGTRIVKFYLHLSKEEQRKRFLERIDEPEVNWKFSLADIEERKFWK